MLGLKLEAIKAIIIAVLMVVLAIAVLVFAIKGVLAHEQYPPLCCNGDGEAGDCHPVDCDSITETQTGYKWEKFFFKPEQAHPSFDRQCHVCIFNKTAPQCVFIQPGS